jgi:hypothetical protein
LLVITNHLWVGTNQLWVVAEKLERMHVRCWRYGLQKNKIIYFIVKYQGT